MLHNDELVSFIKTEIVKSGDDIDGHYMTLQFGTGGSGYCADFYDKDPRGGSHARIADGEGNVKNNFSIVIQNLKFTLN